MTIAAAPQSIRVLHIIDSLVAGGKERQFVELLKGLEARSDVSCEAVVMSDVIEYPEFRSLKSVCHTVLRRSRYDPTVFGRLFSLVRDFRPHIVHSWNSMCSIYAAPVARLLGAKFINGAVRDAPPRFSLANTDILRVAALTPFAHAVVGNSRAGLAAYKVPQAKAVCIYNGFDSQRLAGIDPPSSVCARLGIHTSHVVGMVASFAPRKDYATYLTAAARILHQRRDVTFLAVGDGEARARIATDMAVVENPRIMILGRRNDVEAIVNALSVGVLTSNAGLHGEGISNTIMEYMALGKPVIATNCGGTSELVQEGRTGFLIANRDVNALTARIVQLLDDDGLRDRLGENGRRRISENFSLELASAEYVELYRRLLSVKGRYTTASPPGHE